MDLSESSEIYTVSQLNREVSVLLEGSLPLLWVEGEVSNFAAPRSGHWYFSLKDATGQVRCAMFRPAARSLDFLPRDGMQVLVRARVTLYEARGDYQLIIDRIEEMGEGKLRRAFEALKNRLAAEGLFDAVHKKPLPVYPQTIGVITSPTGAAIRDILSVLARRYPCATVIIYPAMVQGEQAAATLVEALALANQRAECDILLLARGGGSLEDLWPFNEETVARAIFASHIPVISGVGHETDFTIADYVADLRAPTPSVAAEHATPNIEDLFSSLHQQQRRYVQWIHQYLSRLQQQLTWEKKHLLQCHPLRRLTEKIQQLDFYELALRRVMQMKISQYQTALQNFSARLMALDPRVLMRRGFSLVRRLTNAKIVRSVHDVALKEKIQIELNDGTLLCQVEEIHET